MMVQLGVDSMEKLHMSAAVVFCVFKSEDFRKEMLQTGHSAVLWLQLDRDPSVPLVARVHR